MRGIPRYVIRVRLETCAAWRRSVRSEPVPIHRDAGRLDVAADGPSAEPNRDRKGAAMLKPQRGDQKSFVG